MNESVDDRDCSWVAFLLAWTAGAVDAIGYLVLYHEFTAHMSGNTVAMGAQLGEGNFGEAAHRLIPIPLLVLGIALGATLIEIAIRRDVRRTFSLMIAL
jgi:uncharacterized membrane protein YoaK (UPF0700 family)